MQAGNLTLIDITLEVMSVLFNLSTSNKLQVFFERIVLIYFRIET